MAEIEADFRSRVTHARAGRSRVRRALGRGTVVRIGAVALALVGVAAIVARPARATLAEAHFTVPTPLEVGDVVAAIRAQADAGAAATVTPTADARRITVAARDANRDFARVKAKGLAIAGLAAARQRVTALETRRAQAARADRAHVTAQLAAMTARTGLTDPEAAYQERVRVVENLQQQRAAAAAAGQPLTAIDGQLAENQQAVFELQLQVTRHTQLVQAETAARQRELEATRAIDAVKRAVDGTTVEVSDHGTGSGFGIAPGVAALVIAGVVLIVSELQRRRTVSRNAAAEREDLALGTPEPAALESSAHHGSRFLDFYRALEPSPPNELDPTPSVVDLVHEEAVEARAPVGRPAARWRDRSRP